MDATRAVFSFPAPLPAGAVAAAGSPPMEVCRQSCALACIRRCCSRRAVRCALAFVAACGCAAPCMARNNVSFATAWNAKLITPCHRCCKQWRRRGYQALPLAMAARAART